MRQVQVVRNDLGRGLHPFKDDSPFEQAGDYHQQLLVVDFVALLGEPQFPAVERHGAYAPF